MNLNCNILHFNMLKLNSVISSALILLFILHEILKTEAALTTNPNNTAVHSESSDVYDINMHSMEAFEQRMRDFYNTLPQDEKKGALQVHGMWYVYALKKQTMLKIALNKEIAEKNKEKEARMKEKTVKDIIIPYLRWQLENKVQIFFPVIQLSNGEIIEFIRRKEPNFGLDPAYEEQPEVSRYFLKWMYILLFRNDPEIIKFREYLDKHNIPYVRAAQRLAYFYGKASSYIHFFYTLSWSQVETGLRENDFANPDDLTILKGFYESSVTTPKLL